MTEEDRTAAGRPATDTRDTSWSNLRDLGLFSYGKYSLFLTHHSPSTPASLWPMSHKAAMETLKENKKQTLTSILHKTSKHFLSQLE